MAPATEISGRRGPSTAGDRGSRLYANAAYLWGNTALTALAGLGLWVIVASLRDADEVGAGAAAASAMMLLVTLSNLGLGSGLIRFLPEAGGEAARLMNAAFSLGALVAAAASTLFLLGLPLWAPRLGFLRDDPLLALCFVLFTMAATVFWVQDQALLGRRRGEHLFLRSLFHNLMRLLLPLGVLAGLAGATGVVVSVGLPVLVSVVFGGAIFLPAALPGYRPALTLAREPIARLLPFSSGTYASELLMIAPGLTLPLMVLALRSSEETGYFYVAWFLGYLLSTVSFSLGLSLFAEGSHSAADMPRLVRTSLWRGLALAVAGAVVVLVFAGEALLLFGREYSDNAATLLRIVAVARVPRRNHEPLPGRGAGAQADRPPGGAGRRRRSVHARNQLRAPARHGADRRRHRHPRRAGAGSGPGPGTRFPSLRCGPRGRAARAAGAGAVAGSRRQTDPHDLRQAHCLRRCLRHQRGEQPQTRPARHSVLGERGDPRRWPFDRRHGSGRAKPAPRHPHLVSEGVRQGRRSPARSPERPRSDNRHAGRGRGDGPAGSAGLRGPADDGARLRQGVALRQRLAAQALAPAARELPHRSDLQPAVPHQVHRPLLGLQRFLARPAGASQPVGRRRLELRAADPGASVEGRPGRRGAAAKLPRPCRQR